MNRRYWGPWLFVLLPLVLGWIWPRSYGPSLEAVPLTLGCLSACFFVVEITRFPTRWPTVWLFGLVLWITCRGHAYAQYQLMMLPVAASAWLAIALGSSAGTDDSLWAALMWALLVSAAINLGAATLQLFHQDSLFYPLTSLHAGDRPYGNLRQPNHLATLLVAAEIVLWWGHVERRWPFGRVACAALVGAWGITLTGSRIGLLELLVLTLGAWLWRRSISRAGLILFVSLPVSALVLSIVSSHWLMSADMQGGALATRAIEHGPELRWLHWRGAWDLIEQRPWLGVGWREFRWARFIDRPQDSAIETAENAHNLLLQLAVELGIPAMVLIVLPCLVFGVMAFRRVRGNPRGRWAVLVLSNLGLYSLVEFPLWYSNFILLAGIAVGVLIAPRSVVPNAIQKRWVTTLTVGMAGLIVFSSSDYDRVAAAYGDSIVWPSSDRHKALIEAQKTIFFRGYSDYIVAAQTPIRPANAKAMVALTDRLLHFGPDPIILGAAIMARCAEGERSQRLLMAKQFQLAFPAQYIAFVQQVPDDLRAYCELAPKP